MTQSGIPELKPGMIVRAFRGETWKTDKSTGYPVFEGEFHSCDGGRMTLKVSSSYSKKVRFHSFEIAGMFLEYFTKPEKKGKKKVEPPASPQDP